jgi:hypothetical protein
MSEERMEETAGKALIAHMVGDDGAAVPHRATPERREAWCAAIYDAADSAMPAVLSAALAVVDEGRLNDARWAACNVRHDEGCPTMEKATEMADRAIARYLGIDWEDFEARYRVGDGESDG